MGHSPPGSCVDGIFQAKILEWLAIPSPGDLPYPEIEPVSLSLLHRETGSLPLVPPGKLTENLKEFKLAKVVILSNSIQIYPIVPYVKNLLFVLLLSDNHGKRKKWHHRQPF